MIEAYGPSALFLLIGTGHVTLVIYGLYRMGVRPTVQDKTPYIYSPRTSLTTGRFLKTAQRRKRILAGHLLKLWDLKVFQETATCATEKTNSFKRHH